MKNRNLTTLALGAVLCASTASAELPVPRGPDIESGAASCNIGPFGQTGKAGKYNPYCTELTDAEKCLALVKRQMTEEGVLRPNTRDSERVAYCLDEFRRGLLGN